MSNLNNVVKKEDHSSVFGCGGDWRSIVALCAVCAIALAMRLYRLEQQSVWYDELIAVRCLGAKGLAAQLGFFQASNPDCTPLYMILQYLWSIPFGLSPWNLRLFPILLNIICLLFIYLTGRDIFGKKAGLLGALIFAISPANIWCGQMLRFYSLLSLLVMCGVYTCLRIARSNSWKWLLSNAAIGLALLWTHPFALFFVSAEGFFLLLFAKSRKRFFTVWIPLAGLSAFSVFLWLYPTLGYVPKGEYDHYVKPSWEKVAVGFLGNDAVSVSNEFPLTPPELPILSVETEKKLLDFHPFADFPLTFAFGVASTFCVYLTFFRRKDSSNNCDVAGCSDVHDRRVGLALLLCAGFLPVLQIFMLTVLWRPCFESRYFLHCSSSLYLLMGAALLRIRRPTLFYSALTALFALYVYQNLIFLPVTTRTNWREAGKVIAARQNPNDIVLVKGIIPFERDIFTFNQVDHSIPVISAHTIESVCKKTDAFFQKESNRNKNGRVWAVIESVFFQVPGNLDGYLKERFKNTGVEASFEFFPGMEGVLLCCFSLNGKYSPDLAPKSEAPSFTNYDQVMNDLKLGSGDGEARKKFLGAFRRVMDIPAPLDQICYTIYSLLLSEQGEYDAAALCAKRALEILPTYGQAHFAFGVACAGKGDIQAARASFQTAFSSDRVMRKLFAELVDALYENPNEQKAVLQLERLVGGGFPYVTMLRLFKAKFPNASAPDPGMSLQDPLF